VGGEATVCFSCCGEAQNNVDMMNKWCDEMSSNHQSGDGKSESLLSTASLAMAPKSEMYNKSVVMFIENQKSVQNDKSTK
jgi:hypothetical protein